MKKIIDDDVGKSIGKYKDNRNEVGTSRYEKQASSLAPRWPWPATDIIM